MTYRWFTEENIKTIPELLKQVAEKMDAQNALFCLGNTVRYRMLYAISQKVASFVRYHSWRGDRVAIFLPNIPQFLFACYGIFIAGRIAVPINFSSLAKDLKTKKPDEITVTPEIPTLIIPGGIPDIGEIWKKDSETLYKIQKQFLLAHLEFRNRCRAFAEIFPNDTRMILCDRGAVDGDLYVPFGLFWDMVAEHGLRPYDVMESYDGVVYLRSAARLGDGFYSTEDNKARMESREEAAARDEVTLRAWIGHPHLTIIESCEDFSAKLRRVLQVVLRILGMPVPLEIERKFFLRNVPDFDIEALSGAQKVLIEQMYCLMPDGEEFRIRKRTFRNSSVHYKTKKTVINSRVREEYESVISPLEYLRLQKFREPGAGVIQKERFYFVYNNQYFELDCFLNVPELVLLEAELTEENDVLDIPPFCDVVREVIDEPLWRNREIARRLGMR